jgi:LCP family protein required for cell wall assembly
MLSPTVLRAVLILDLVLLLYRLAAVVDAFRMTAALQSGERQTALGPTRARLLGPPRGASALASLGLVGVLVVTPIAHLAAARYDLLAYDLVTGITGSPDDLPTPSLAAPATSGGTGSPGATSPAGSTSPSPTATSVASAPPWTGKDRLNILLLGADQRPNESTFNTDTMIVVSIDPGTGQMAMLSLPRDMSNIPLPPSWPAHDFYANGLYPDKITTLWTRAAGSPGLFPFPGSSTRRGFDALKGTLGYLYGLNVQYYVEVNFDGFEKVVDTLGGLTIDVQVPVMDVHYPKPGPRALNLYIAPGIQHMDGSTALAYARSRHASSDFDRAARQQRVIVSARQQTDPVNVLANLDTLVGALKSAVHTDIPPELFPSLVRLAQGADTHDIRQLVFTPPVYGTECSNPSASCYYSLYAKVPAIRAAVRDVFKADPKLDASREALAEEDASVAVYNGSGKNGQASDVADYLQYLGFEATVGLTNGGRADSLDHVQTSITVYNGAESRLPKTIQVLESTFGVKASTAADPNIKTDVVVITGSKTPNRTPPD